MAALDSSIQQRFVESLVPHLEALFPRECVRLGPLGTRERVRCAMGKARRHGFGRAVCVIQFVHLAFLHGEQFDAEPAVRRALGARRAPDWLKIRRAFVAAEQAAEGCRGVV